VLHRIAGDAPDPGYPTLLANDGARHVVLSTGPILYLGLIPPDTEVDGQPSNAATGDGEDEDGAAEARFHGGPFLFRDASQKRPTG
jgi:hypothetical protein